MRAEQGKKMFPVADKLEKEVVNLWVFREYNKKRAFSLAKVIKKNLS